MVASCHEKTTTATKGADSSLTNKPNTVETGLMLLLLLLCGCNFHQTLLNKLFDANSNWKFARNVLGFDARVRGKICEAHNRITTTTKITAADATATAAAVEVAVAVAKKNTHIHFELEMI